MVFLVCLFVVGTISAGTNADLPVNGTYQSADLGGGVFTGRISESWVTAPSGYGQVGNTILLTSINGPAMGTQWEYWCASITAQPMLVADVRDSVGTGEVVWSTEFEGGEFWLAGDGPWGTIGWMDFTGTIDAMTATTTFWYLDGMIDSVQSVYTLSGRFDPTHWDGSCVECTINCVAFVGSTDEEPSTDDYPPFMASNCEPSTTGFGAWGTTSDIEVRVFTCSPTPVRDATWGGIKALYTD
jgi:hypothetical protein